MTERQVCTAAHRCPNPPVKGERWQHPDAKCVAEDYGSLADGGSYEKYQCPHCGNQFWVELPD